MSIADHFEQAPDAGFIRDYDGKSARRQFNISVVLIVALTLAAAALGALVRFEGTPQTTAVSAMAPPPSFAGKL